MVEIRINGELVTFDGNFRDAFIFTIDYLRDSEELYESTRYWQNRYSELMTDYLQEAEENIELKKQLKRLKAENWQLKHRKRK
ncbi:TPA: hypothetical protein U3L52_001935 [Streptococcus agalactiae]|uniref:hypothetical protein n=1 Tax=Streptococcus agalactiae TaxID=1311 RepID=UPI0006AC38F9|nr:hypothetical protein [Streptococcus agalactiae]ALB16198.1 hypothetical protein AMD29_06365 [Streptococcus agalactiae]ASA81988.1 hypothetical protein BB197_06460 [Streptococcus agalactiae]ASA84041.1 hypothetical protein BB194_06460 [Streptococcus agalactiae]ASA86091.1 hypothetical protein BB313_06455 [Streptococcus agalactiae]ASA88145.1 hypothetical protein BB268_06460 [Streptococcus agalactiae]